MHFVSRMTALCLALLYLMMTPAMAEAPFLVHSDGWSLDDTPVDVLLTADVSAHMPFDDDRLAMLTPIIDLLSLRLVTGENAGIVTISAAGEELLTLLTKDDSAQLSCLPDLTFSADANPADLLLGSDVSLDGLDLFGIRADGETLLDDGEVVLAAIPALFADYGRQTKGKTNISGMGTAQYRYDYTIPAEDAAAMKEALLSCCPEGWLHDLIASLTFSGKQTLRMYYTSEDVLLRVEFTGNCGVGDDVRKTNLIWRMRRDDVARKDDITLLTPATIGTDKNNLTFTREIKTTKSGAVEMTGEFAYTVTKDKQSDVRKGDFTLTNAYTDAADVISGKINLRHLPDGDNKYDQIEFEPDLTIAGTEESPVITGTLTVREKWGKGDREEAVISIDLKRAEPILWEESAERIDLSALTAEQLAEVQSHAASAITTALVRPLIVLLGAEGDWFFRDLPGDAVQSIIDAASNSSN